MKRTETNSSNADGKNRFRANHLWAGWKNRFRMFISDLETLNRGTEHDFLAIGSNLRKFYDRARDVSDVSSSVAGLMAGTEIVEAICKLQGVTERTGKYLDRSKERAVKRMEVLEEALEMLKDIGNPINDLKSIIKNMRYLSLSTRIYSARVGHEGADFIILAGDINRLSELIEIKSADIKANLRSLHDVIENTISRIMELQESHRSRLREILNSTKSMDVSLTGKHELSIGIAENVSLESKKISENIGEIVESMQFHDITRQQFDHVGEALAQLADKIDARPGENGKEQINAAVDVRDICSLQLSQINHAKDELLTSVNRIIDNLGMVSRNSNVMLDETRRIADIDNRGNRTFLYEMERSLSAASSTLKVLSENAETNQELSKAMEGVFSTVSKMSSFISDMDVIESEIEVIALNARVKAANIGERGAALGVVAKTIQQVSVKAHGPTASISESIKTIRLVAEVLSDQITADDDNKEIEDITNDMEKVLQDLRTVNNDIHAGLMHISKEGEILSKSINQSIKGMNVHNLVSRILDRVVDGIKGIIVETLELIQTDEHAGKAAVLEDLSGHYTMRSEHTIHRSYVASKGDGDPQTMENDGDNGSDGKSKKDKIGFGDNVEFF